MKLTKRAIFGLCLIAVGVIVFLLPFTLTVTAALLVGFGLFTLLIDYVAVKRENKKLAEKLTRAALIAVAVLISLCGVLSWNSDSDDMSQKDVEFVVVLGAQIRGDQPSRTLRERLDLAALYLSEHPQASVFVTGGQGTDEVCTEAEVMHRYLIEEKGISADRITMENRASDTRENLIYSRELAQSQGVGTEEVLIITSEFHMLRAKFLALTLGMEPYGLTSTTTPRVLLWNYYLREIFAFVKAFAETAAM